MPKFFILFCDPNKHVSDVAVLRFGYIKFQNYHSENGEDVGYVDDEDGWQ